MTPVRALAFLALAGVVTAVLLLTLGAGRGTPSESTSRRELPPARVSASSVAGVLRDPVDKEQQLALRFGDRSHWLQPWRAYLETLPAKRLHDALGINFNVEPDEAEATARLLASAGFTRARVEIGWGSLRYDAPAQFSDPARFRTILSALKRHGIRPLILLNSHHGVPCPTRFFDVTLAASARAGDRTLRLDSSSASAVVPGRTGLVEGGKAAAILFTGIAADGTATLSRPLPRDLAAGSQRAATLLYAPFERPEAGGRANPDFEATLQGWLTYAATVVRFAREVIGSYEIDVEIWNELTFGSDFLNANAYYEPDVGIEDGGTTQAILERTVAWLRDPAQGFGPIGIGNGFANQRPWDAGSTSPPGLTAIDKHPYAAPRRFPADARFDNTQPIDALGRPAGERDADGHWRDRFIPAYVSFLPEYYLTAIQTEHIVRDLSPFTTDVQGTPHGRATRPDGGPAPTVWITEWNLDPRALATPDPQGPLSRPQRRIQAKAALRALVAYVSKGVTAFHFYAAKGDGLGLVQPSFFEVLERGRYPGDRAGGITIDALRRLTDALGPSTLATALRQLTLRAVADRASRVQFQGDGSDPHPALTNRDVLAFFPFQASRTRFVVATYVMTRNVTASLPADRFRLTIGGVGSCRVDVSASDPLTGKRVSVDVVSCRPQTLVVELPVTDSPRLLTIDLAR